MRVHILIITPSPLNCSLKPLQNFISSLKSFSDIKMNIANINFGTNIAMNTLLKGPNRFFFSSSWTCGLICNHMENWCKTTPNGLLLRQFTNRVLPFSCKHDSLIFFHKRRRDTASNFLFYLVVFFFSIINRFEMIMKLAFVCKKQRKN